MTPAVLMNSSNVDVNLLPDDTYMYLTLPLLPPGNFITDIMLEGVEAEVALLNSGTLRSDRVHPRGEFRMRDLLAILPMVDPVVVINITGRGGYDGGTWNTLTYSTY